MSKTITVELKDKIHQVLKEIKRQTGSTISFQVNQILENHLTKERKSCKLQK